jgi:hypothetical protein
MPDEIRKAAQALNQASARLIASRSFTETVGIYAMTRIVNSLDNMRQYPSIFTDLENATTKPGASNPDWRAQVDAIIYAPMDGNAAQRLIALIEMVDA